MSSFFIFLNKYIISFNHASKSLKHISPNKNVLLAIKSSSISLIHFIFFCICSYVTRIEENAPQGTALVFPDPYIALVSDDDTGKNGVFSLTLLGNNGTFEISPNVAERRANFLIRVRDNQLIDYESYGSLQFQVIYSNF